MKTAGHIENSQVAVYLVHAGQHGRAAVDRELYIPRQWAEDVAARCQTAGLNDRLTVGPSLSWPPR